LFDSFFTSAHKSTLPNVNQSMSDNYVQQHAAAAADDEEYGPSNVTLHSNSGSEPSPSKQVNTSVVMIVADIVDDRSSTIFDGETTKDTFIDGTNHPLPPQLSGPPPPVLPSSEEERFFKPVNGAIGRHLTTIDGEVIVSIPDDVIAAAAAAAESTLGRRDVVTPPIGTVVTTTGTTSTADGGSSGSSSVSVSNNSNTATVTTTPQLSPLTLANIRGMSSPSNSQVGSATTMNHSNSTTALLNAVLSKKHYDLTPVMRNTSSDLYCDGKRTTNTGDNPRNTDDLSRSNSSVGMTVVTPSSMSDADGYLHGEHLAFPSDLSRATLLAGPTMPPLQPVPVHRRHSSNSNNHNHNHTTNQFLQPQQPFPPNTDTMIPHHNINISNNNDNPYGLTTTSTPPAVQFPSRKYYSFTTREQYEEACRYDPESDDDLFIPSDDDDDDEDDVDDEYGHLKRISRGLSPRIGLTPYAPNDRPAIFDIEQVPEEELKRIFISRGNPKDADAMDDRNNSGQTNSSFELPTEQMNDTDTDRMVSSTAAVPFGPMRIPSLHMANQLCHNSTTSISYTDQEDEDSIVVRINSNGTMSDGNSFMNENDDASMSSLGSNVNLQSMVHNNQVISGEDMLELQQQQHHDDAVASAAFRQQRKRKQRRKKEQEKAMEWLQSVEAHPENDIAEAASSKFLTTSVSNYYPYHRTKHRSTGAVPLQRQMSVPANTKTVASSLLVGTSPFSTSTATATVTTPKINQSTMNRKAPPS
jgi:hypothetical protein